MTVSGSISAASIGFPVRCNLCDADDAETIFEAGVAQISRIVRCRRCSLMYSNPRSRPVDEELVRTYDAELTRDPEAYDRGRFDKEQIQVRDYDDTREYLASLYPQRGSLVEVGCGTGFLLKKFHDDGWDVLGVEPDVGLCEFVQRRHKLKASPTTLEAATLPDDSADVIVMLHVIEHVPDPLATLREVWRVLRPGGHLVIETPRYDTVAFAIFGRRERSISCDGHIYFFTTKTLRRLCEKAGFSVRQSRAVGRSLSLRRVAWNFIIMSKSEAVERVVRKMMRPFNLEGRYVRINIRDMQRVILQKT